MKYWTALILTIVIHAEINLIATPACRFETIDKQTVKRLFMKKSTHIYGQPVQVYDNRNLYKDFTGHFIQKTPTKMNIYWTRMIFTGTQKPPKKMTPKELAHIDTSGKECQLSYISGTSLKGWKTVHVSP